MVLAGGYALKAQCLEGFGGREYSRLCYNDIQPLYGTRGVAERSFPYIDGALVDSELVGGAIEYPVLTGVFMWGSGLPVSTVNSYFVLSALLLAPFALLTAYLLYRMAGMRALLWAAAPAIVLYAFHNWDLLAVAAAGGGLYLWWRGRPTWSAALFGVGGALKLYPLMFLGPLVLEQLWSARAGGSAGKGALGAARAAAAGTGVWLLINLPFMVANFDGWYATYAYHRLRTANFDSIWQFGWPQWTPSQTNLITTSLLILSFVAILGASWFVARRSNAYPFVQTCAALLAAFLLFNKVHSPQYTLWLLPFFALLRVNLGWWIAYSLADLAVYVGVFRWFYDIVYQGLDFTWAKRLLITGVWTRAALLGGLVVVFMSARIALKSEAVAGRGPVEPAKVVTGDP